jgi:nucleoside-diphosphate-sugar epimerase
MNVTVFGATGAIGQQVVEQLYTHGHAVTAYVRNPGKVPASWSERVRVEVGEITDADAIDRAVAGADAVVSALGPSMDRNAAGLSLVDGTRHIVEAMRRHGVRRYVGNGTPSVLDPRERPTWQTRLSAFMAKTFLRRAYDEMVGMGQAVTTSGLDWTIVRFLAPKDGPARGELRQGFYGTDRLGFNVTRSDIAAFTAAQVDDRRYVGAAPAISN